MQLDTYANLRAPYEKKFTTGGKIHSSVKLKVLSTQLFFDFEQYYHGTISEVIPGPSYKCLVKAVYKITSKNRKKVVFNFVTPSEQGFGAKVNNTKVAVSVASKTLVDERTNHRRTKNKLFSYSIRFNGELQKGINSIHVSYIQPISAREYNYGYFSIGSSNWKSYVEYHYWPIKEWERADTFTTEIHVSVPYEWGIFDYLNGPDIDINLFLLNKEGINLAGNRPDGNPVTLEYKMQNNRLTTKFLIKENLPDILRIQIRDD
jgi:hypothetical protein